MATEQPIITHYDGESDTFTAVAYECKFAIDGMGNMGEAHEQRRVTFEGYATPELYAVLIEAIRRTVGVGVDA